MYRLNLALGLRKPGTKRKGKLLPEVWGAIAVMELTSPDTDEIIHPNYAQEELDIETAKGRYMHDQSLFFKGISVPKVFSLLREMFENPLINSNADVIVNIGDGNSDYIVDYIPREVFVGANLDNLTRHYLEKIKQLPILREVIN